MKVRHAHSCWFGAPKISLPIRLPKIISQDRISRRIHACRRGKVLRKWKSLLHNSAIHPFRLLVDFSRARLTVSPEVRAQPISNSWENEQQSATNPIESRVHSSTARNARYTSKRPRHGSSQCSAWRTSIRSVISSPGKACIQVQKREMSTWFTALVAKLTRIGGGISFFQKEWPEIVTHLYKVTGW